MFRSPSSVVGITLALTFLILASFSTAAATSTFSESDSAPSSMAAASGGHNKSTPGPRVPDKVDSGGGLDLASLEFLLVAITMAIIILVAYSVHNLHSDFVSESGAIIILGIVVGGLFYLVDHYTNDHQLLLSSVSFDRSLFINVLLPIIIFEAGFSLKHTGVMRNLGAVLVFAVAGTLISSIAIGLGVYYLSQFVAPELYNHPASVFICLALGALLSATDTVSVLALLGSQFDMSKEPPLLYNIVFGESALNDAVAIVIYEVCQHYIDVPNVSARSLGLAFGKFVEIFIVSTIIGYIVGLACAKLFKHCRLDELPHLEVAMIMIFGAISYYLCDFLNMSGIMGLFVTARIIGHHATHNMSPMARSSSAFVLKTLACLAEMVVFVLLGTSLWVYNSGWNPLLCCVIVASCLVSRVIAIFPLSALCNLFRTRVEKIHLRMQVFMWYSGLRGAIAFGLVILLNSKPNVGPDIGGQMLTSTLAVIIFTVLLMGAMAATVLNLLGLGREAIDAENQRIEQARLEEKEERRRKRAERGIMPGMGSRAGSLMPGGGVGPSKNFLRASASDPTTGELLPGRSSETIPFKTGSFQSSRSRADRTLHPKEAMMEDETLDDLDGFGKWIIHMEKVWIQDFVRREQELEEPMSMDLDYEVHERCLSTSFDPQANNTHRSSKNLPVVVVQDYGTGGPTPRSDDYTSAHMAVDHTRAGLGDARQPMGTGSTVGVRHDRSDSAATGGGISITAQEQRGPSTPLLDAPDDGMAGGGGGRAYSNVSANGAGFRGHKRASQQNAQHTSPEPPEGGRGFGRSRSYEYNSLF